MVDSTATTNDTTSQANLSDVAPLSPPDAKIGTVDRDPATSPQSPPVTSVPATPAQVDPKLPPANTPQKFEIQLQNPPPAKPDYFEAKVVIPGGLAIIGWGVAIFLFCKGRSNKINDDLNDIVIDDVKEFLEKIEELTRLVASHQSGCPCQGTDLKESRRHLTTLRQSAMAISNRIDKALLNEHDREEWKTIFRQWKTATEDNTDWITNKTKKWSQEKMNMLDQANDTYTGQIANFRNRIATRKIKLR